MIRGLRLPTLSACDPFADPCVPDKKQNNRPDIEELKQQAENESKEDGKKNPVKYDELLTAKIMTQSCDVCKLFGSPWLAARVMIKDLFILEDSWAGRVELRDGVGIDRDTETARQGVKYDFEVVPATSSFDVEIVVENADDVDLGLLLIGLRECESGRISLGGKTTRGLGHVQLDLAELEVIGDSDADVLEGEGSADLLEYFKTGKGKKLKGAELREYIKAKVDAFVQEKLPKKE